MWSNLSDAYACVTLFPSVSDGPFLGIGPWVKVFLSRLRWARCYCYQGNLLRVIERNDFISLVSQLPVVRVGLKESLASSLNENLLTSWGFSEVIQIGQLSTAFLVFLYSKYSKFFRVKLLFLLMKTAFPVSFWADNGEFLGGLE
jgi:hypothetical protein